MCVRWIRRIAVILMLALAPDVAFAAPREPRWLKKTSAAAVVQVTMQTGESFEAIWIGRDGDRAVFERLSPDEIVSVPIRSVQAVRMLRGRSSSNTAASARLGAATGFFGTVVVVWLLLMART